MAKTKSASCAGCGVAIWPDNRRAQPWLCMTCRYPDAGPRTAAPVWRLADRDGSTTGIVLEACPRCAALPAIAATHPHHPEAPRAITWAHAPGCQAGDPATTGGMP